MKDNTTLSSCCHTFMFSSFSSIFCCSILIYTSKAAKWEREGEKVLISSISAVLLTNFTPCITTEGLDTPARFYRFPITASIHYMCQTIYHDSTRSHESFNVLYYHYRFVIFTVFSLDDDYIFSTFYLPHSLPMYKFTCSAMYIQNIWVSIKSRI